jgi:hypothetical protein
MKQYEWTKKLGAKYLYYNAFNIGITILLYKIFGFQIALLALVAAISTDVGEILKYVVSAGEEK